MEGDTLVAERNNSSVPDVALHDKGMAPIKPEYLLEHATIQFDEKFLCDNKDDKLSNEHTEKDDIIKRKSNEVTEENKNKFQKKMKGQNKNRRNVMYKDFKKNLNKDQGKKMCLQFCREGECRYGDRCTYSHDLKEFIDQHREPDIGETCYNYSTFGKCKYGVLCRFGLSHLKDGKYNQIDEQKYSKEIYEKQTSNHLSKELQISLRKKNYDFSRANKVSGTICSGNLKITDAKLEPKALKLKKKLDFNNKLYLAPLTTVGNLPFRRICKEFGADITCGEMALCQNILEGSSSEWALLRKHHTEDIFGVQICGGSTDQLARCAQVICEQCDVDFIDLNMGCPIDLVYKKGAGSALMERRKKLEEIIYSISTVANVPLTLKMRTGVYQNKNIAKDVISFVREWKDQRVGLITLHGRSREQRYTKLADWEYIKECALEANKPLDDYNPIPIYGSGDIMSQEEYYERVATSNVNGVMFARGALIKPWIFKEIRDHKTWDITANERLDILKKYVNYGLENWGSDNEGVEKTRRFLLEWLSFLYRYIPVGLLERLPQKINERPPRYFGRNDLETLMSSASCKDWISISEMLLGKVPNDFTFIPKHKANAY